MEKIKCMVVDDLESIREHFCTLVSECADMTLVCEAESGREAIERAKSAKPDIILMDIQLDDEPPEYAQRSGLRRLCRARK